MQQLQNYIEDRKHLILETKVNCHLSDEEKAELVEKLRHDIRTADRIIRAILMRELRRTKRTQMVVLKG